MADFNKNTENNQQFNYQSHVTKSYIDVMTEKQKDTKSFHIAIHKVANFTTYNNDAKIPYWTKLANYILINYKYKKEFYYSNEYLTAKINRTDEDFRLYNKCTKAIKRTCKELVIKRTRLIELLELGAKINSVRCQEELGFLATNYETYKELMEKINSEIPNTKRAMRKLEDMSIIIRAQFTNENRNGSRRKVIVNKQSAKFIFSDFNVHSTYNKMKKRYSGYLNSTALRHGLKFLKKQNVNTSLTELKEMEIMNPDVKVNYMNGLGITAKMYAEFNRHMDNIKEQLIRALRTLKRYRIVSVTNSNINENLNAITNKTNENMDMQESLFIAKEIKNYLNFQHNQSRTNKHVTYYYKGRLE